MGVTQSWTRLKRLRSSSSHSVMSDSLQLYLLEPTRLLCPWNSPGKNTGEGNHSLLQKISLTQGSNPGLPHCRQTIWTSREIQMSASLLKLRFTIMNFYRFYIVKLEFIQTMWFKKVFEIIKLIIFAITLKQAKLWNVTKCFFPLTPKPHRPSTCLQ